jgi:hypothetical protein
MRRCYLAVFQLIQRRDCKLANTFDDLRRSTALRQLALIQSHELLSEEEFGRFSVEKRGAVESRLGSSGARAAARRGMPWSFKCGTKEASYEGSVPP